MDTFPLQMVQEWVGGGGLCIKGRVRGVCMLGVGEGARKLCVREGSFGVCILQGLGDGSLGSIRTRGEGENQGIMHIGKGERAWNFAY